ncbi:MAG: hypothetical protein DWQ36_04265 [Acidobacteria bacterium]|nr:MAG: hypothetical protein DWQ30_09235 [Acidobacteriota bacterium]REK10376.1 MAG: hypothetical protein DWQ36_04265 [Acidobacteriota bacterium]
MAGPATVTQRPELEPPVAPGSSAAADRGPTETEPRAAASPGPHPRDPENGAEDRDGDGDPTTVWIGRGASQQTDLSSRLHQASVAERDRRRRSAPPIAVIDDENLAEYAKDVKVTIGSGPIDKEELAAAEEALAVGGPEGEEYWRSEALRLRLAWREAYDSVPELEADAARLRNEFYAADDPFYRDREIKPAWDRTLDRIEEAKEEMQRFRDELEDLLERGRRAGALPGWLREGIELEPVEDPEADAGEQLGEAEPGEPIVVDPPRRRP